MQLITLWKCYRSAEEKHLRANFLVPAVPAHVRDRWGCSAWWGILTKPFMKAFLIEAAYLVLSDLVAGLSPPCSGLLCPEPVCALSDDYTCLCATAACVSGACRLAGSSVLSSGAQVGLPWVFLAGSLRISAVNTQQRISCCMMWRLSICVACCQVWASVGMGYWAMFKAGNGASLLLN